MCVKKAFPTPNKAKHSLRTLQRKTRKSEFDEAHVYRCPHCGKWHIGHSWTNQD